MFKITVLSDPKDGFVAQIVATALCRSFTPEQVRTGDYSSVIDSSGAVVLINPTDQERPVLGKVLSTGGKALVLGRVTPGMAEDLGLLLRPDMLPGPAWAEATRDAAASWDSSRVAVRYAQDHPLGLAAALERRPLCRYDFLEEWNTLGYGRIASDGGPWALACGAEALRATSLAWLEDGRGQRLGTYAALADLPNGAALWINRPVGPVDSVEWQMVESFLGDHRPDDLPCFPYLLEIPAGVSAVVTARLDCDQALGSARRLVEAYAPRHLPLSLAVPTGRPLDADDLALAGEVITGGGCVVSHSADHSPNWGGSYQAALDQAVRSRDWLRWAFGGAASTSYAVSPFHQNPVYAVQALADAGYAGVVSGIACNDPEFLLGRAGRVPLVDKPIVTLSQQCMLHGDCFHRYGSSVDAYLENFESHRRARAIFGYLDHPFSADYTYGWSTEEERISAHEELISRISAHAGVRWASLQDCLDFLVKRDSACLGLDAGGRVQFHCPETGGWPLAAARKGQDLVLG